MLQPRTIHDFGGFPRELYEVQYAAQGQPELATRIRELLTPIPVASDKSWGLDHGTWRVLSVTLFQKPMFPVVQLSIDENQPPPFHCELGKRRCEMTVCSSSAVGISCTTCTRTLGVDIMLNLSSGPFDLKLERASR